jgi:hypothetical protein
MQLRTLFSEWSEPWNCSLGKSSPREGHPLPHAHKTIVLSIAWASVSCLILAVSGGAQQSGGQKPAGPTESVYRKVVETLFPLPSSQPAELREIEYKIVLRFLPSFSEESQIVISKHRTGNLEIVEYRTVKGVTISSEVQRFLDRSPDASAAEISRQITIQAREIRASASQASLVGAFFNLYLSVKHENVFVADGTTYELWYETISERLHYSVVASNAGSDAHAPPVVRWMNSLKRATRE